MQFGEKQSNASFLANENDYISKVHNAGCCKSGLKSYSLHAG